MLRNAGNLNVVFFDRTFSHHMSHDESAAVMGVFSEMLDMCDCGESLTRLMTLFFRILTPVELAFLMRSCSSDPIVAAAYNGFNQTLAKERLSLSLSVVTKEWADAIAARTCGVSDRKERGVVVFLSPDDNGVGVKLDVFDADSGDKDLLAVKSVVAVLCATSRRTSGGDLYVRGIHSLANEVGCACAEMPHQFESNKQQIVADLVALRSMIESLVHKPAYNAKCSEDIYNTCRWLLTKPGVPRAYLALMGRYGYIHAGFLIGSFSDSDARLMVEILCFEGSGNHVVA